MEFSNNFVTFPNTERVLREYGERVRAAYRENLRSHGHFTMSGATLLDNIQVEVVNNAAGSLSVSLRLADYWKYLEDDTRPHWAPPGVLLDWIRVKPILPRPDGNGRIPKPEQLDYLIRRKIAEEGTKGTHDLATAVDAMNAHYLHAIEDALVADIDGFTTAQIWLLAGGGK